MVVSTMFEAEQFPGQNFDPADLRLLIEAELYPDDPNSAAWYLSGDSPEYFEQATVVPTWQAPVDSDQFLEETFDLTPTERLHMVLPLGPHRNPEDTLNALAAIEERLASVGLEQLIPFNRIYRTLTARVIDYIEFSLENPKDKKAFKFPETVARTIGIFADYYIRQVRAITGMTDEKVDPAWQFLMYPDREAFLAEDPSAYAQETDTEKVHSYALRELAAFAIKAADAETFDGVKFLIGMNAHINYDLPQALRDSKVEAAYFKDYRRVIGMLIDVTAKELGPEYIPGPTWTRKILQKATVWGIAWWRNRAWKNGVRLMAAEDEVAVEAILSEMDRTTQRIAKHALTEGEASLRGLTRISRRSQLAAAA